jgi:large subunit ribosomal protein L19e
MRLAVQKRLAATLFKCSQKRVWFDEDRLSDIKESITKQDIKGLISEGAIRLKPPTSISKGRARKKKIQKSKGLQKGSGSKRGGMKARMPKKKAWMAKVRVQRGFLKLLREKGIIKKRTYQDLYLKSKGGFFRSKRHIKLYVEEHKLTEAGAKKPAKEGK